MDPYGHCQRQRYPMVDSRYLNIPEQIGFSRFRPPNPRFINYHPRSHFPHQIPFAHERFGVRNGPNFCNNQNFIPRVNQQRGSWRPRTNHTSFNSPIDVFSLIFWYWSQQTDYHFEYLQSLQFGFFISAVDPVATISIFRALNVNDAIFTIVFGESTLNDAAAIALSKTAEHM